MLSVIIVCENVIFLAIYFINTFMKWGQSMNSQQEIQISLVVLLTGLVVVFSVLIFLTFIIKGYGSVVHSFLSRSRKKSADKETVPEPVLSPVVKSADENVSVAREEGIPEEVITVISAAAAAMFPSAVVTGIQKAAAHPNRSAWGMAGLQDNTRPF